MPPRLAGEVDDEGLAVAVGVHGHDSRFCQQEPVPRAGDLVASYLAETD